MTIKESLYLEATNEFESDDRNPALWAKCMSLCEGDEQKAKYRYINDLVKTLEKDNKTLTNKRAKNYRKEKSFLYNLSSGNYSLAQTYWLYGVVVGIVLSVPLKFITSIGWYYIYALGVSIYQVVWLIGIWRSSDTYNGPKVWAILAKLVAILGWLSLFVSWILLIANSPGFTNA